MQTIIFRKQFMLLLICTVLFSSNELQSQYVVNGNAVALGGNCFRLTTANFSQSGAVWSQNKLNLEDDFTINASIYLGNNDGGADGIAFVLQPVCNGIGGFGGGIGYQGINPSLAIEFDTWYNGDQNDPTADHIALQRNGSVMHDGGTNTLEGPYVQPNMENNANHPIIVNWDAGSQTLTLNYDGNLIFTYVGDIVADALGGFEKVYWGFTAATGSAFNEQRVCIGTTSYQEETPYTVTDASCPNLSDGSISLDLTGGVGPYSFAWSNGSTNEDLTSIPAGNYSVSVTDDNGCVTVFNNIVVGALPDTEAPVVSCPNDIVVNTAQGTCKACVIYDLPTASDNCGWSTNTRAGYTYKGTYNGSDYFLSNITQTGDNARAAAYLTGGHLAVITNAGENAFVGAAAVGRAWIGLHDLQTEGTFQWETGEPYVYKSWFGGEPNNSGNEDYGETNFGGLGLWNDVPNAAILLRGIVEIDGKPILVSGPSSGDCLAPGSYEVTYEIFDLSGNQGACSFNITVEDNEAPTITCTDVTVDNDPGVCGANVDFTTTATDNCGATVVCDAGSGDFFPVGSTTVTCTATDAAGNEASCDFEITVIDNEAPTAICQDITVSPNGDGNYPIDADDVNNGSTDNCRFSYSVDPTEIPCFHDATVQTVTLTVTDDAGNTAQCTASVTLLGDDDCDGVGNACDLCPGGNDQVDNDGDGNPDCAVFPGLGNLISEWTCGNNNNKVLICHIPPGNPNNSNTLCVAANAVQAHLNHGCYVGPCDNASCDGERSVSRSNASETFADVHLYPNPASNQLFLLIHGIENKAGRILMYESSGRLVKVLNVAEFTGEIIEINLAGFSQGVYYIAVETEGTTIERQRFVITR
ncbi:MAG: HYR domain-containing protein [Saprospiraceae bacterium]|nr:HYR domain-containing protein [Saprospiraceae bacterium]